MALSIPCPRADCAATFTRRSTLRRHEQQFHSGPQRRLSCAACAKTFSRQDLLDRHLASHHGGELLSGSAKQSCPLCSRAFRTDYLTEHVDACGRRIKSQKSKVQAYHHTFQVHGPRRSSSDPLELRWKRTTTDLVHSREIPPTTEYADGLRVGPSLCSNDTLQKLSLVERAQAAIASCDATQFVDFLDELDEAEISLKDLGMFMRETRTRKTPNKPLIVQAARQSNRSIVEALVERGVDVNEASSSGERAIHCAKDTECLRILIKVGAIVKGEFLSSGGTRESALSLAVKERDLARASVLVDAGARPEDALVNDVIRRQDDDMFRWLLPWIYDFTVRKMLYFALRFGTASMTAMLLGRDRYFGNIYGRTGHDLLRNAEGCPHASLGTKAPYPDALEKTWLLGLQDGLSDMVGKAAKANFQEDRRLDEEVQTSLELLSGAAASRGGPRQVESLDFTITDLEITIRMILVFQNDTTRLRRQDWKRHTRESLLQELRDVKSRYGEINILRNLFMFWFSRGLTGRDISAVKLVYGCLLEHGWNIHQKIDGLSLLHRFHSTNSPHSPPWLGIFHWLLDHGAAINELTDEQPRRTLLAMAVATPWWSGSAVEWLISRGARADGAGLRENELRPLTAFAKCGFPASIAKTLLEAGARIYPEDDEPKIERLYRQAGGTRAIESFGAQHDHPVFSPGFSPTQPLSQARTEEFDPVLGSRSYRDPGAPRPPSSPVQRGLDSPPHQMPPWQ